MQKPEDNDQKMICQRDKRDFYSDATENEINSDVERMTSIVTGGNILSITIRWKRKPSIGIAVFLIGLAGIAQIPTILFAQIFLVVNSEYLLILVPLGATLILAAAEILLTEILVRRKKGRRKQLFGYALKASLVVLGIFFAIYFLPFMASYVLIPPEPIRTLSRAAKFVIMINSAAIATVILTSLLELGRKTR